MKQKHVVKFGRDLTPKQEPPKPAQKMMRVAVNVIFRDGTTHLVNSVVQGAVPDPGEGQPLALEVTLDARQIIAELEAKLGPR